VKGDQLQVELVDFGFLLPDLRASLERDGFLVASSERPTTIDVLSPDVSAPLEAAALIAASANRWAALRGVPIIVRPATGRVAHPAAGRVLPVTAAPTVSIALPVFNGESFLADALDSLLSQSYADFEVIICDNASGDRTREISEFYVARDDRVRYLGSDANRGAPWNFNRGLAAASGRYFKWAAHDDLCAPTYLERCVEVLDRAPASVVLAYPKTVLIDESGRFVRQYEDGLDLRDPQPYRRLRALIRNLELSNAVFGLIRRDALENTRRHGTNVSADYILLAELALLGQFWEIPEPLFLRREHTLMSRRAHRTSEELAEEFEVGARTDRRGESFRLFAEYTNAVRRAQLKPIERIRTYSTLLPWLWRFCRSIWPGFESGDADTADTSAPAHANPSIERVSVIEAVRDAIWAVAPDFTPLVRIHIDPGLSIATDRSELNTILVNLVSNAVRYGSPPVTIGAGIDSGDFSLVVEDEGRGISRDFVPRLFDPFSRSSESEHASAGLGLGLAVAALSAREIDGMLLYEPREKGSRFRLVLPTAPPEEHFGPRPRNARHVLPPDVVRYSVASAHG
jgi:glycosyltransferase involved in cell wall biosynthesis